MPIQVFVDESARESAHFVMAGIMGEASTWASFSDQWDACLRSPPAIAVFKMREAMGLDGAFYGMAEVDRDRKVVDLVKTLDDFGFTVVYIGIDLTAFDQTVKRLLHKPFNNPYALGFQCMILSACAELLAAGQTERFEIIFDEHKSLGPKARRWYPFIEAAVPATYRKILPVEPIFRTDNEFLPLQASDLMAGLMRINLLEGPGFVSWVADEFKKTKVSGRSYYLTRETLMRVHNRAVTGPSSLSPEAREIFQGLLPKRGKR
jgi:hypothetical protein